MSQISILDPMFVQVLLTLSALISLAVSRGRALYGMDCGRGNRHPAMARAGSPDAELPGFFSCVLAFALITRAAAEAMIAWLCVAMGLAHAAIHVGPNEMRWRTPAFALGRRMVMIARPKLALNVAMAGPSRPAPGLA